MDYAIEECAECPKCMQIIERKDRVNLLKCDKCQIYLCYNCGKEIGGKEDGEEGAKKHYEVAYCRYIDAEDK